MSGPLPSIFDIPELFDMVLSLLSIQDLARCVLVNKQWHDAAIPHLWHTISLGRLDQTHQRLAHRRMILEDYIRTQDRQTEQMKIDFTKQCQRSAQDLIKADANVDQRASSYQSSLSKHGPLIRYLANPQDIFCTSKRTIANISKQELLFHFVKHCVNVRTLVVSILFDPESLSYPQYKIIADSLAPNLQELFLQGNYTGSFGMNSIWYLYIISRCSSRLQKLTIYNKARQGFVGGIGQDKLPVAVTKLDGLKELVLDYCWNKDELASWDWFWRCCGNVERLELRTWHRNVTLDLAARIRAYLPKVNSIVFKDETLSEDIAPLLSACAGGWKFIRTDVTLNRLSCEALTKHCDTLKTVQVTSIFEFSSKTLRHILSSSPRLKTLITSDADDNWNFQRRIPYLEAKDFVDEHLLSGDLNPWACESSLRVLKAKITCIPRPDVTKILDRRQRVKETCAQVGKQLQKRIYERLSRFINLEELCLGHGAKENRRLSPSDDAIDGEGCQYDCLEMTLEGGLDQLKGLKNLRVLDVRMMAQRIGIKEVNWMSQHWPRLRAIRGLCDDGDNLEAAEWLWKHSPMITVEVSSRASIARQF